MQNPLPTGESGFRGVKLQIKTDRQKKGIVSEHWRSKTIPNFGFVRRETPSYFFSATFLQHFFIASHFLPSLQALTFLQHFFSALSQTFSHFSVLAFLQQDFFTGSCAATLRAKTPMHRRSINFFMMFLFLVLWNVFLIERLKRLSIWFDWSEARRFNPSPANVRQNAFLDLTKHT